MIDLTHQLITIVPSNWNSVQAVMHLYERSPQEPWRPFCLNIPVVVGACGLAWGIGLHPPMPGPIKHEGDRKSPAGIFDLGMAFGFAPLSQMGHLKMDYLPLNHQIEAIDDPESRYYNQIVDREKVRADWKSSEKMGEIDLYVLGARVLHNYPNPKPNAGSAIFLHLWSNPWSGTGGCTAMSFAHLSLLLNWLDKAKQPALVQLPLNTYVAKQQSWGLPQLT